ncbi:hypothetical protein MRB53_016426 [Persea americana]|uniref:Uncharacterized protein n=1 Tax=Persea americana TaxID=3435 RepID=A0ACC2M1X5_PERAE|nr:hypothetical protein MRB53_016426 [Persea americana]
MTLNWYHGDLGPHLGPRALVSHASIGFMSAEELGRELEVLKPGFSDREFQRGDEIMWYADGDKVVWSEYNPATAYAFDSISIPKPSNDGLDLAQIRAFVIESLTFDGMLLASSFDRSCINFLQ